MAEISDEKSPHSVAQLTPLRAAIGSFALPLLWAAVAPVTIILTLIISGFAVWITLAGGGSLAQLGPNDSLTLLLLAVGVGAAVVAPGRNTDVRVRHRIETQQRQRASRARAGSQASDLRVPLAKLAAWPAVKIAAEPTPTLELLLAHAADVMGAPRIIVVWEKTEEPDRHLSSWTEGRLECLTGWLDDPIEGLVAPCLVNTVFAARAAEAWSVTTHDGLKSCSASAVSARFRTAYNIGAVVSAPFSREGCRGRVFALDCALANSQLSLVEIVADRVGLGLEYCFLLRQVEATAAEREKSKLAHDLHDGLLQNLTAATLLLKVCSGNCEGEIRHNLDSIRKLLAGEQRRLRHFVNGWRHKNGSEDYSLAGACKSALTELSAYWNCHTSLRVSPRDARLPAAVAEHLWLIFTEAIANAVKHGKASRVRVYVVRTTQALAICISDNGRGFHGLAGSYTDDTLVAEHIGPQSLCERVRGLRGHLSLSTSPAGSRLQIRLPI